MRQETENQVIFDPLNIATQEIMRLERLLKVCSIGLTAIANLNTTKEHFRRVKSMAVERGRSAEIIGPELDDRFNALELARDEKAAGFRTLFAMGVVKLTSILETAVTDFMAGMLCVKPELRRVEAITRLKGSLVEFAALEYADQAEYLVEALQLELKTTFKLGVGKFESLLGAIGLGGNVDEAVKRLLLELFETRNAIVHREGRADKKLVKNCPWLDYRVGDPIRVIEEQFSRYAMAAGWYVFELEGRMHEAHGEQRDERSVAIAASTVTFLSADREADSGKYAKAMIAALRLAREAENLDKTGK